MNRQLILLISHFLLCGISYAQLTDPGRGMYVNRFFRTAMTTSGVEIVDPNYSLLGIPAKEDSLLKYVKENHITYLILYDLHRVLGNPVYENYLCSFIQKAKANYGVEKIGMASSCASMFGSVAVVNATPPFYFSKPDSSAFQQKLSFVNRQHKPGDSLFYIAEVTKMTLNSTVFNDNCSNKIDVMVTEYEFWNSGTDNCLDDNVTKDQKYARFQQMIVYMDSIRDNYNATHPGHQMYVETYLGFLNQNTIYQHQAIANWIDGSYNGLRRVDRINLHYYSADASKMYSRTSAGWNTTGYYQTRFLDFCQGTTNSNTNILPIFSAEYIPWGAGYSFLGTWFNQKVQNNIFTAEKIFYNDWFDDAQNHNPTTVGNVSLGNVIQPGQALWFTSSYMKGHLDNPVMFTSNSPVCVSSGQLGQFQFQYQGPIEQGLSFNFYITDAGSNTIRCGTQSNIAWPSYNPLTQTGIDLNAALGVCALPVGDYDAHLTLNYAAGISYRVPPSRISVVTSGRIVALTPVTVCQGNPVYLHASSTDGGTTTYLWYNGTTPVTGATAEFFAPNPSLTGTQYYSCQITSSKGSCSVNKSNTIAVTINAYPTASITQQSVSGCTAVLRANPTSAVYKWHDGSNASTYTANLNGNYSVAVTVNGCTNTAIYSHRSVSIEKISQTNSCSGFASGSLKVNLYWGTPPYSLTWTGPSSGSLSGQTAGNKMINNLPAGTYIVTVADAGGCSRTLSPNTVISNFPAITIATSSIGVTCSNFSNGSASISGVTGGAGSPYSYFWSYNNSTASSISSLPAGSYNVVVTDAYSCSSTANITVPVLNPDVVPSVTVTASPARTICFGEPVYFSAAAVNGGNAPVYLWKRNGINTGTNSSSFSSNALSSGDVITCTVTSNALCVTPPHVVSNVVSTTVFPNSDFLNDNNVCTTDGCDTSTGVFHDPVNIDDNDSCTTDGCDSLTGIYHSQVTEICGNGTDDNCDGLIDENCIAMLNVKVFIEGYYLGNNSMNPVIDPLLYPMICDSLQIELRQSAFPYLLIESAKGTFRVDGHGNFAFPYSIVNQSFYIVLRHRNALETWSSHPVLLSENTFYDFSDTEHKAYGNNLFNLGDGNFALFSGDIIDAVFFINGMQDGLIESMDYNAIENAVYFTLTGYVLEDLTGDRVVETADAVIMENNMYFSRMSYRP